MVNIEDIEKGAVGIPDHELGKFSWRVLLAFLGPGFLISMAYLDPGNLAGDLDSAVYAGYHLLWVLALATFCGFIF
jgi:natural resistance-associated macrophage protein